MRPLSITEAGLHLGRPARRAGRTRPRERQAQIPKDLPVYIFAGGEDPVSEKTRGLEQLRQAYAAAGLRDVTHRSYPGARHVTLNETIRDEVTRDLLAWLDARVPRSPAPGA